MSSIATSIRGLERNFKKFFNTLVVLPIRILTALRVVVSYENSLHRIILYKSDGLLCPGGLVSVRKVPEGEIWIPEVMQVTRTTGSIATFNEIMVRRKGYSDYLPFTPLVTADDDLMFYRGIDYGEYCWLYYGDEIIISLATTNATDKLTVKIQYRRMRVGEV